MSSKKPNKLEKLLAGALEDPALLPFFFRLLLESTVYVVSPTGLPTTSGKYHLTHGDTFSILSVPVTDNTMVIPFFSSLGRLKDFLQADGKWIGINTEQLFVLTRTNPLVLNPNSNLSMEFDPANVDDLLEAAAHQARQRQASAQAGQPDAALPQSLVRTGPPEPYPAEAVDSLTAFFATCPQVRTAYVGTTTGTGTSPDLVLGIDAEDNTDVLLIINQAGAVVMDTDQGPYSSLIVVDMKHRGNATVADLWRSGTCFYDKSWGARLISTPGQA